MAKLISIDMTPVYQISPELDSEGNVAEFTPAERYKNSQGLSLNAYGQGPFCKFSVPEHLPEFGSLRIFGIYDLVDDSGRVLHSDIRENLCDHISKRHGRIAPRDCYEGGKPISCRVNNTILNLMKQGRTVTLRIGIERR